MLYERQESAFEAESVILRRLAVLAQNIYADAFCKIRLLAEVIQNPLEIKFNFFKNLRIGRKSHFCARFFARADSLHFVLWLAALEFFLPPPPVPATLPSLPV